MINSLVVLAAEETTESKHNPIFPIWQEVLLGAIAFGLLCWVLMKFVFPQMEKTFRARVDAIEGGIKRAEAAQAEANELLEQYRAQLAEARTEAARIRDEARADAEGIRQDVLAKAREESDRIIAAGNEQLAAQRESIVRELRAVSLDKGAKPRSLFADPERVANVTPIAWSKDSATVLACPSVSVASPAKKSVLFSGLASSARAREPPTAS